MARRALIVLALLALTGCENWRARSGEAAITRHLSQLGTNLPDLDKTCTARMGRARPQAGEPWVITHKRWKILADNRDQEARDCGDWWDDYRAELVERAR